MNTNRHIAWATSLWLVATIATASAASLYVSTNGNGSAGTDWDTAYTNVQHALDAAVSGDTIYVAGHRFDIEAEISWTNTAITLIGGYAATNALDQPGPSDPTQWPTVFQRSLASLYRILYINGADNSTLENVRLTGGQFDASTGVGTHPVGSGVRIDNSDGFLLSGCIIDDNTVVVDGNNSTLLGAGLYASGSTLTLINCRLEGNVAVHQRYHDNSWAIGGAIWSDGTLKIEDSRLINNKALAEYPGNDQGAGLYFDGTSLTLKNVLVAGNVTRTAIKGAGVHIAGGTAVLDNISVGDNIGVGIFLEASASTTVSNSIAWNNWTDIEGSVDMAYSLVGDSEQAGQGNIQGDPLFEYGYYLESGSPAIAAGSDTAELLGLADYTTSTDGDTYASGATVNLGYHYTNGFDLTWGDLYVATDGDDGNNGLSSSQAFRTLTKALDTARDGSRIHVAAGTYNSAGGETFPLVFPDKPGIQVLGEGAEQTVLDADGAGTRVMDMSSSHRSLLSDLTLTGGRLTADGDHPDRNFGSGLRIQQSQRVLLSGCLIEDNQINTSDNRFTLGGGGIQAAASHVELENCRVENNLALNKNDGRGCFSYGGGVLSDGKLAIRNSVIDFNTAGSWEGYSGNANSFLCFGGGLYFDGLELNLRNVLFAKNTSTGLGDGLFINAGDTELENCTVSDNDGQGVFNYDGTVSTLNSILWGNGIDSTGTVTIAYSVISNSTDYVDGGHNLGSDPLFVDASAGDYHLQKEESPAIGAGLVQDWMAEATDLDGNPRVSGSQVDLGVYQTVAPGGMLILLR